MEIALRDLDDLAGNARRVAAADGCGDGLRRAGVRRAAARARHRPWLRAADEVAEAGLRLKFRTGGLEAAPFPAAHALARWIDAALDRETPFKCTAGLHNAVRHTGEDGFAHHGFLNVLLATVRAFDGAARDEVVAMLERARPRAPLVAARRDEDLARARRWFTSFGSCSVNEPLDDLIALGLLESAMTNPTTWVEGAAGSLFDVDNLPYGVFSRGGEEPRVGVRIGDLVLDVAPVAAAEMLDVHHVFEEPSLNPLMAEGRQVRAVAADLADRAALRRDRARPGRAAPAAARRGRPCTCRSRSPTTSTSTPRSSTPPTSAGCSVPTARRCSPTGGTCPSATTAAPAPSSPAAPTSCGPSGQRKAPADDAPSFGPRSGSTSRPSSASSSARRSALGDPVGSTGSPTTSSGVVGLNDWSARDIQAWEYVPLGPFLGKSFATSVSHWVTPLEALDAAWVDLPGQDPEPLPYLPRARRPGPRHRDRGRAQRRGRQPAAVRHDVLVAAQMLAHMTVNGASLRTGDLYASGTVCGPERDQRGSLLELSWGGREPSRRRPDLPRGRRHVTLRYTAPGTGGGRIALGEVTGTVVREPARARRAQAPGPQTPSRSLEAGVHEGLAASHRLEAPGCTRRRWARPRRR